MAAAFRRTRYFVERGLQLRFARFVILLMFGSSILTALIVFYGTFSVLSDKLMGIYPQGRLVEIFKSTYVALFAGLVIMTPIIFMGAVMFSHRVAGPLPKIYAALRKMGDGDFNVHLTLRKGDELTELVDEINRMAAKLKAKERTP